MTEKLKDYHRLAVSAVEPCIGGENIFK